MPKKRSTSASRRPFRADNLEQLAVEEVAPPRSGRGAGGRSESRSSTPGNDSSVVDRLFEDGGKTAHYMLRWVATTGEKGP